MRAKDTHEEVKRDVKESRETREEVKKEQAKFVPLELKKEVPKEDKWKVSEKKSEFPFKRQDDKEKEKNELLKKQNLEKQNLEKQQQDQDRKKREEETLQFEIEEKKMAKKL